jgi:hypothetical protein
MRSTARLEWFLGSALILLVAQLGFRVRHGPPFRTWTPPRDWSTVGPVAIPPGWSVILEERPVHPLLSESEYRLRILGAPLRFVPAQLEPTCPSER